MDIIRVVGKTQPVKIYELVSRKGESYESNKAVLENFRIGLSLYRERKWNRARQCFEKVLELDPYDKPSQEYLRRCREYAESPPAKDWEGMFDLRSK